MQKMSHSISATIMFEEMSSKIQLAEQRCKIASYITNAALKLVL